MSRNIKIAILFPLTLILLNSCEVTPMLTATFSKDYCSCRFIVKQSDAYCKEVAKQYIPVREYVVNMDEKTVFSKGLGHSAKARFVEGRGCHFVQEPASGI